uniref:Uncharacterized protein n=1 Tax=Triticum urartu TaxID=4572 RepID=A0A8R7R378_TRIUA
MLAGSMNNDNDNVIDLISDSGDDFDSDSDDPTSTNVTSGENGGGQSVCFQDEDLLRSTPSSSRFGGQNLSTFKFGAKTRFWKGLSLVQ